MSIEQRLLELADETLRDARWKTEIRKIAEEVRIMEARIQRLEEALRRIANQDYRGNRSTESQIAFDALKEAKP